MEGIFTAWVLAFPSGVDGQKICLLMEETESTPGVGRSPGQGNGYPLQYSCLENPMDREPW